ncbi:sodium glucose cotransporter hypothetical protein [Limosa lapponica baueri]|uniref:Sodium/mannose cotransporter SLC5A10 n=1 Tax=Limosa lapponica baueri TaxID=1758121 RepID=A0A2I0TJ19_LIMLA|nr:sodium glucose cotransporter hypothetical protein [Limosa lapponica baueri]
MTTVLSSCAASLLEQLREEEGQSRGKETDLYSGALFVQVCLGWDLYLSTVLMLVVTGLYTIAGGLAAVIYTDALQTLIMVLGAIMLAVKGRLSVCLMLWGCLVIVQRSLSAKNLSHAKAGSILASYLKMLPLFVIIMPGMISRVLYPGPEQVTAGTPAYLATLSKVGPGSQTIKGLSAPRPAQLCRARGDI